MDKTKRRFLDEWVRAVNAHDGFGTWAWAVSRDTADVSGIIENASFSRQKDVYIQRI